MKKEVEKKLSSMRLYGIITDKHCRLSWLETAKALIGKVDVLQLRENELPGSELLRRAKKLRELTDGTKTLLIINDRPDIALMAGADGVHVGQDDLPAPEIKRIWGEKLVIGLSTHTLEQARQAEKIGVDYIGIGPIFATDTKNINRGNGIKYLKSVCRNLSLPHVAIGGINEQNARLVIRSGAQSIAAISALCDTGSPDEAATRLLTCLKNV